MIMKGSPGNFPSRIHKDMLKTLKAKVSLVYISLVCIIALLGLFSVWSMVNINAAIDNLIVTNYNSIQRLKHMDLALSNQNLAIIQYLYGMEDHQQFESRYTNQKTLFQNNYDTEYQTIIIPYEMGLITNIRNAYQDYLALFPTLIGYDLSDPVQLEKARLFYAEQVLPQMQQVQIQIDALTSSNENALFSRKEEAMDVVQRSILMLLLSFLAAVIIGYVSSKMYTNKIFRPIYDITQNVKAIRQGNMNRKYPVNSCDELGTLCEEFNNMTQRLAEFEESTLGKVIQEKNRTIAIMRSIAEPMIILDSSYHVILLNQSFEDRFHVTLAEAQGQHFLDAIRQSKLAPHVAKINYRTNSYEEQVLHLENGEEYFYNVMVTPFSNQQEQSEGVIIVFYNITEMKTLEKLKSDFIATISHEFKTPLTSIVMGADLLGNETLGSLDEEQKEIVEALKEDSQRLVNLVSDMMELSKVESSSMIYNVEKCDISHAIHTSVKQFLPLAEKHGTHLVLELPTPLPLVLADSGKVIWVMNNLLSNAVRYTGQGDIITVTVQILTNFLSVTVADTGPGIPEEFLERIFEKYVQVSNYDIEMRGTGLGLAAAREIITALGGTIHCESELEKGSRFIFTLPLADTTP